ncbi:hypothetical protein CEUSTIGMA_g3299.t1 [Chlamydomonas eustigma]|uniref:Uncharacterized protein n=1 Tax=Chlamydomonas eustigma TaxID=1157962 RepID=A0A250WYJ7_9CHLO|nr:hypothetical protein CEUSTIGMA_g3299.t1 [Chlamydomonas eustigma]|eukprot:GAX75856.1 hypothetical protein CEUSTIGMA_g3299.t1 [Chlamydomonas eustigma]
MQIIKRILTNNFAPDSLNVTAAKSRPFAMAKPYYGEKWWDDKSVAVVTGANKGIGFEVARELGKCGITVIVAARQQQLGEEARDKIQASPGCSGKIIFHQLDITDASSIIRFASWVKHEFPQGLDIVVNNAGMAFKGNTFGAAEALTTLDTNFFGTMNFTEAIKPSLRDVFSRVVIVSSRAGKSSIIPGQALRKEILFASSKEEIGRLGERFIEDIQNGKHAQEGWPNSMYGISKLLLTVYSRIEAKELEPRQVMVNACCPGWCKTDMSSWGGPKTALEGADTPLWLALRTPSQFVTGKFFGERMEVDV